MEDSDTRITGLMADRQPPHNAMSQGPSDGEHVSLSNTLMQPETHPVSQLETTSMPDESLVPCHTPSDLLPDSPQNVPAPDACQPAIVSDVRSGTQQAFASPSPDSAGYSVAHMDSGSDDNTYSTNSIHECGGSFVDLSTPSVPSPCPLLVPLPESDVEEDPFSESLQDEGVASTASSSSENSDAYTTSTGGRTSPSGDPEPQNVVQPSAADDYLALWILGDSVLERHDRRVYERWKAGLGVTFVLAGPITRYSSHTLTPTISRRIYSQSSSSVSRSSSIAERRRLTRLWSRRFERDTEHAQAEIVHSPRSSASSSKQTPPF
ncbi:hypothetical protein EDB92DRAFT_691441 [Lactarius akahatsu]|uniref:Uncharacterized protein n=1 Tax=Lactarius akahatsu TaxID=416441 RepID=A0AAD4L4P7_9AGAM|nr:hypothetical protein EDB92DRAFT_691441 [Lactarius akahatsu]